MYSFGEERMSLTDRLFSPSFNIPPQEGGTGSATGKKVSYFLNSLALCLLFCGGAEALPQDWGGASSQ